MTIRSSFVSARTPAQQEYQRYLRSFRWRFLLRPLRIWFDGGRCCLCGRKAQLQVHHRDYQYRGKSLFREFLDLTTLCDQDHSDFHDGDKHEQDNKTIQNYHPQHHITWTGHRMGCCQKK